MLEGSKDARLWGMLCHLGALAGFIGIPFGHIIGPLVFWLIKRNDFTFVDDQGKQSLNFQITLTILAIISVPLCLVFIGYLLLAAIFVCGVVYCVIGAIKANDGYAYRYPFAFRLIK